MTFLCSTLVLETWTIASEIPPTPNIRKGPAAWMGYGLMFLFFAVVLDLVDDRGENIKNALPSSAIEVLGWKVNAASLSFNFSRLNRKSS